RDGRSLLFTLVDTSDKAGSSIWVLPMQGDRKAYQLIRSAADDRYPHFSPDGRWVVYRSNESGRNQIYVIPFGNAGAKQMISSNGGDWPVWRKDGQELYFLSPESDVMAVTVHSEESKLIFTVPKALFKANVLAGYGERFAASADGSRFLALVNKDLPKPL